MKPTLHQGLTGTSSTVVSEAMTAPALADQFPAFAGLPSALSTAGLIGFVEQASMELLAPHLDEGEFSVGIDVELTHTVATPGGDLLTADLQVIQVERRAVLIAVTVSDAESVISVGRHRRAILDRARFVQRLSEKASRLD
ncbi:MAG: thioesterase family protein [Propionibacteriaceae bacterium]|jgi:fluoroacetyl-CoA thioesterase|nr:thioesterase family protein [Propionibacteriaceae bacterium]